MNSEEGTVSEKASASYGYDDEALLKNAEAAGVLGVSEQTLRGSRHSGKLLGRKPPPYQKRGHLAYYKFGNLKHWNSTFPEQTTTAEGK